MATSSGHDARVHRKPSATANSDGAKDERALALKRSKSGYIGQLTKYYNEARGIIEGSQNPLDIDVIIKIKNKTCAMFEIYRECHEEYLYYLTNERDKEEALRVYQREDGVKIKFDEEVDSWIATIREQNLEYDRGEVDDSIRSCDSISQVSSRSTRSSASSTASKLKLRAEAKRAVATLKLKQLAETQALQDEIYEAEVKLKIDEAARLNKMKRRKALLEAQHEADRLTAEIEVYENHEDLQTAVNPEIGNELYDNINARENPELQDSAHDVYKAENNDMSERGPGGYYEEENPNLPGTPMSDRNKDTLRCFSNPFVTPKRDSTPKESTRVFDNHLSVSTNPFLLPVVKVEPPSPISADQWLEMNTPKRNVNFIEPVPIPLSQSLGYDELVKQQEKIMSTMANALRLPKPELFTFDGNPLSYWRFIRNFERNIEQKSSDEADKLNYLLQYCTGKAKEVVRNCVVMDPSLGYTTARKLLKERFGEPYVIASAHIEQITKGPPLKASDREGLLNLADKLKDCELTLKSIGYLDDLNSADNLKQITERFPLHLKARWLDLARVIRSGGGKPNIAQMSQFISERAMAANDPVFGDIMDSKDQHKSERPKPKFKPTRPMSKPTTYTTQVDKTSATTAKTKDINTNVQPSEQSIKCWLCEGSHMLTKCPGFESKGVDERLRITRGKGLCDNCFKRGHKSKECYQRGQCTVQGCTRKHHALLHGSGKDTNQNDENKNNAQCNANKINTLHSLRKVCLPIVPVRVRGGNGETCVTTYALLDKGSDTTLCEERLLHQLKVKGEERTFSLTTVNSSSKQKRGLIASLEVMPLNSDDVVHITEAWSVDKLCITTQGLPTHDDLRKWPHLSDLTVPAIDAKEVQLLIGTDTPEVFWTLEERRGNMKEPYAVKSILGWTIVGPVSNQASCHSLNAFSLSVNDDKLMNQVEKFWKADFGDPMLSVDEAMSVEDRRALKAMEEGLALVDGHYQVALPWRLNEPDKVDNRQLAESRLQSLKRRLKKNNDILQKYKSVIEDHIDKGYARRLPDESIHQTDKAVWYLPHHAVFNARKPDKLRVVYDCAAKWKGLSLNDQLLQGPDMTNSLVGVLTRFRERPIALASDIEAMFLQVKVHPKDRDMLRFLWYEDGDLDKPPTEFQMLSHVFGATSSPSIAGFALRRTAEDNRENFDVNVVNSVYRNFYVDDFLKSVSTVDEARDMAKNITSLLQRGGFRLTKWISNDMSVLNTIPEEERAKSVKKLDFESLPNERTLGVHWEIETDRLGLQADVKIKPLTRRGILSAMSSVFDPLGIVAPFMLPAKLLLQSLCKQNIQWDDPIPDEAAIKWSRWLKELPNLSRVSIPRCLEPITLGRIVNRELHHFGDASQSAYGAISYLRSEDINGRFNVSFLLGRSRLAPVKTTTIPRLELSAAVLAVKQDCILRKELDLPIQSSWFWSDSMAVLRYIFSENRRFSTFVANRVSIIHEGSDVNQWYYVDTKNNPADDASRGLSATELSSDSARWLKGPEFLHMRRDSWPKQPCDLKEIEEDDPEVKREKNVNSLQSKETDPLATVLEAFSSWDRLRLAVAWLLRFKRFLVSSYRIRHGQQKMSGPVIRGPVSVREIKESEIEIIKLVQRSRFQQEMKCLDKKDKLVENTRTKVVPRSSPVYKLNPIVIDGLLCVGGRLENATIPERSKHPPLLPKSHHVSELIIRHYHQMYGHAGKEHVLSLIRREFWIIGARVLVKRLISQCFDCRRRHAPCCEQVMANLPQDRLNPDKPPFSYVGVDYFGPIQVKRGRTVVKRYGCLFTCLVTRAVHIEIAHSLDTCSFIDALYRFINRRGKPLLIRSDNGTNFRGAERELRESIQQWNDQAIQKVMRQREIQWLFNPPAASNMGGVWERLIRSIREILRAILKEQMVDDETLLTVITHVEAILNSRPLTPCSDDPKDENPLTPNQILLMRDEASLPPGVFEKDDCYGRRRWRQAQYIVDQFWKRWLREYLPRLQERSKWNAPRRNIAVNDVVLVVDQSAPRGSWPLARVLEVNKGRDGYVRSVKLKTKSSILTRPVNKLCLLEGSMEQ